MVNPFGDLAKRKTNSNYSHELAVDFFGEDSPKFTLVSCQLQEQNKFEDGKPLNELANYFVLVAWPEKLVEPFKVKLPLADKNGEKITLNGAKFGDKIQFEELEMLEFSSYRKYFQAKSLKKA